MGTNEPETKETPPEGGASTTEPTSTPPAPAKAPPWGSDSEFDPKKAWDRIQQQAKDIDALRQKVITDEQTKKLAEYDQLVEASKTELEKAQEAAARVAPLTEENLRLKVAIDKNVPATLVDRLKGSTVEELEADAAFLLSQFAQPETGPTPPKPNPAQGTSGSGAPDHAALVAEAKKSGDWKTVIALENQKLANTTAG